MLKFSQEQVMHKSTTPVIISDPEIMGGKPIFRGTRVPLQNLIDHLENSTLEEFLEDFPGVSRAMAITALEEVHRTDLLRHLGTGLPKQ
jgi:uncharacterized protein (DUF433 family)